MESNHTQVSNGFRILRGALAPYIAHELQNEFGDDWWKSGIMTILRDEQKRDLPQSGSFEELVGSLDISRCLLLFSDLHWQNVYRKKLSIDHRTWAKELIGVRNRLAHLGADDFSLDDTWRALDTMSRLCDQIDPGSSEAIRGLLRTSRYGSADGSTSATESTVVSPTASKKNIGVLSTTPVSGLPSWRNIMEPHPDVAQGRYKNAEFAADLSQVARGEGALEYQDPVEFFARTYVTEGMTGLLEQSLRRVCGMDGEPVIQLKTAFGGGKTHSMLALYHLMRGRVSVDKIPNVKPVLARAGVSTLPKANVAVLVGTALDPTKSKRPNNMPGITINTLWGEMAAQLADSAGDNKLYDLVKEADKKGVSPGSEALKNLFDKAAPCIILMDELVAYAKKIYGANGLPAGTFDNFITFIQEVTEAARASKNSLVVAAIPESDIEIGGEAGRIALETIEHTFGRMESIWKPVAANEGFEVVRRRLFLDCKNPDGRYLVCSNFSRVYNDNINDFPLETKEVEYRDRMISCYPIHPEFFDRLYKDWATLDGFQRTRGVLRLMAAVIHELWMSNDAGLMIMPGSIPLDAPAVKNELTRYLSEGWNAIVDGEIDGKSSLPYQKDQSNPRYGSKLAARRVARTIMLGSAPTVRDQSIRGIEISRIRLGVVQPGESIADFNDALSSLASSLHYLYSSNDRYWYDTRPTLRKTAEDRATQVMETDIEYEVVTRLQKFRKEQPFSGVHVCPSSSLDVPDEQSSRLVILHLKDDYKASIQDNYAKASAIDILNNRGTMPRNFRNMLTFIAPDHELTAGLKQAVRSYLAWKSIKDDRDILNLDATQNRETDNNLSKSNETVDARIKEAYCWLLVPYIDRKTDMKHIVWDVTRISGGDGSIISRASKKVLQNEAVIMQWAPALLLMELDETLWKDSDNLSFKKLWEYLCTYCYLPRLASEEVLMETIKSGLTSKEYFAFASRFDGTRYLDLKYNTSVWMIERSGYLVKKSVAEKQIADETPPQTGDGTGGVPEVPKNIGQGTVWIDGPPEIPKIPVADAPKDTHFFMTAELDTTRINRDVQKLLEEVVVHLTSENKSVVKVSLDVNAELPNGLSQQKVRTITENCKTLGVKTFGFDE